MKLFCGLPAQAVVIVLAVLHIGINPAHAGVVFEVETTVMDILGEQAMVIGYAPDAGSKPGFQATLSFKDSGGILHGFKGTDEELQVRSSDLPGARVHVQGDCDVLKDVSGKPGQQLTVKVSLAGREQWQEAVMMHAGADGWRGFKAFAGKECR